MTIIGKLRYLPAVLALGCSTAIAPSAGAAYPERNIDVIITYGAGGAR